MRNFQDTVDLAAKIAGARDDAFARGELPEPVYLAVDQGHPQDAYAAAAAYQCAVDDSPVSDADILLAHWTVSWFHHGLARFDLSYHAATAFALTDSTDVCFDEIRVPCPAFLLQIPTPSPLRMKSARGGYEDVVQVRVLREFRYEDASQQKLGNDLANIAFERPMIASEREEFLRIRTAMLPAFCFMIIGSAGSVICARSQAFVGGDTLGDRLFHAPDFARIKYDEQDDRMDVHATRVACSMVVNTLLWLQQVGHSHPSGRPIRRKHAKNDSGYRPVIYAVGSEIKLGDLKSLRDHARESSGAIWSVKHRHAVRGHWKQQVFGAARAERKRIFVQPYWRGPEAGEALMKTYKVTL